MDKTIKALVRSTKEIIEVYKLKNGKWCDANDYTTEYEAQELKFKYTDPIYLKKKTIQVVLYEKNNIWFAEYDSKMICYNKSLEKVKSDSKEKLSLEYDGEIEIIPVVVKHS